MKLLKIALTLSVVLYAVCVGFLVLSSVAGFNQELSTPEMLYGPAITIVSAWIIFEVVCAFSGGKKHEKI
jgi:hypothetical protein